jgi:hypothetical protein
LLSASPFMSARNPPAKSRNSVRTGRSGGFNGDLMFDLL